MSSYQLLPSVSQSVIQLRWEHDYGVDVRSSLDGFCPSSPGGRSNAVAPTEHPSSSRVCAASYARNLSVFAGPNNLPPLSFHSVHGENIQISRSGRTARRVDSFCKGIAFSNRAVQINERIYLRFVQISTNWSGGLRFGFTSNDPSRIHSPLPKYACPDLANKSGFWAKALAERHAVQDSVLYYYVTEDGEIIYGIDGVEMGIFMGGVDVKSPLWAILDVYGNTLSVEFVDIQTQLNNRLMGGGDSPVAEEYDEEEELPNPPAFCFHDLHGQNITLQNRKLGAVKMRGTSFQGYVFTSRALKPCEKLCIDISGDDGESVNFLTFGLTTCNPSSLSQQDLPDDPDDLMDRPEYWVVKKDVVQAPRVGDSFSFRFLPSGEVQVARNSDSYQTFLFVDGTQELWAFFDIQTFLGILIKEVAMTEAGSSSSSLPTLEIPAVEAAASLEDASRLGECILCCEQEINSIFYDCGHACMCFQCAKEQWSKSNQCPMCRRAIKDVIRIYSPA
ncbi:NEURL1B [Cordylochernes scorpioides]|uniref:NEURL1B n=1 Tax=Cordylochernes scorpioides TaxID=51811 RepID=A0ABY6KSZ6_9ARAC|nr:NEURL1B [Cordylochernes scorpioides]